MILMGRECRRFTTVHQNDHQKVTCLIKTDGNETTSQDPFLIDLLLLAHREDRGSQFESCKRAM